MHAYIDLSDICVSYEEEDICVSDEEEDTRAGIHRPECRDLHTNAPPSRDVRV